MASLHNRVSHKELKAKLYQETFPRITFSFYRYFPIVDPQLFRDNLFRRFRGLNIFGRVYVATEGINGQVSVPLHQQDDFRKLLDKIPGLEGLRLNRAIEDNGKSFWVLKIKVRSRIVADGITDPGFDMRRKGSYVDARKMNQMLEDPETIVIDMRNHYEYEVGHFDRAIEIPSDTFREQLPMVVDMMKEKRDKNIIMYCTGGIRCEKASAYMKYHGFSHVYHLEGGVIHYARQVREEDLKSRFIGKNFVFDDRLGERITPDIIARCHQCGKPADTHVNCANDACHLLFIQCDECRKTMAGCCSDECRDFVQLSADQQRERRRGIDKGRNIFNKSRSRLRPEVPRGS